MGRPDVAIENISTAGSAELTQMSARVTPELRSTITGSIEIMTGVVVEELKAKFSYREDFPMKLLLVMCPYFLGDDFAVKAAVPGIVRLVRLVASESDLPKLSCDVPPAWAAT